jgi:phosphomevalonate kinase
MKYEKICHENLKRVNNNSPRILAFVGRRYSGKSMAARIVTEIDPRFKKLSFADSLREMYSSKFNVDLELLKGRVSKEEYRRQIKDFSYEVKKEFGQFVFAENLFNKVTKDIYVVIDDMRFIEELQLLCLEGGIAYRVYAENHIRSARGWRYDPNIDDDLSETELGDSSGYTMRQATRGGIIFNNTLRGEIEITAQLEVLLSRHFPPVPVETYRNLEDLVKKEI